MTLADLMGLFLAGLVRLITGAQGHWIGCAPTPEQRIYFANHQSHLDWVMIWAALPRKLRHKTRPIAARDYWMSSRFRHWLTREVFNAVYLSRQVARRGADDAGPLEPLLEALRNGDSLVIFPEGTRGNTGIPDTFKPGIFHIARQFPDVPLIPAWVDNVQRVMPKGEVVPVPMLCSVSFGAPMRLEAGETKRSFLTRTRDAVLALKPVSS